jgi:LacI family transcriptional regulator
MTTVARSSPTRADVAKLAGVSEAVVSYVMNDGPRPVSEGARERVKAAVAELGYRPNQVARALRGVRSSSLGLLLPDAGNPFFWELAQHIESECLAHGYVLFVGTTGNDPERERRYLSEFADRQVDGLVLISTSPTFTRSDYPNLPVVLVDRAPVGNTDEVLQSDNFRGGQVAVSHLIDVHQSRHVLLLAGPEELDSTRLRKEGALAAIERAGVAHTVVYGDFSLAAGHRLTTQLLSGSAGARQFDSIFAFSDVQGIGALRACHEQGVAVPGDLPLVSFDGTELAEFVTPSLTTVRQNSAALAANAFDAIEWLIRTPADADDEGSAPTVITDFELRLGGSCGCGIRTR